MIPPSAIRWHTFSFSMKPCEPNIDRKMFGYQALLSRTIFSTI